MYYIISKALILAIILNSAKSFGCAVVHQELTLLNFWINGEILEWFSNFYLPKRWETNSVFCIAKTRYCSTYTIRGVVFQNRNMGI